MGVLLLLVLSVVASGVAAASGILRGGTQPVVSQSGTGTSGQGSSSGGQGAAQGQSPVTATPTPSSGCDLSQVSVTASTDKATYAPGENPLLSLKVTNDGSVPCDVNLGTSQMEFAIMSGADRIFSSRDCQAASEDLIKTIQPGKSETANFPWERNRTVEGCSPVAAKPGGGGATYVFTAKLGNKQSQKAVFQLG